MFGTLAEQRLATQVAHWEWRMTSRAKVTAVVLTEETTLDCMFQTGESILQRLFIQVPLVLDSILLVEWRIHIQQSKNSQVVSGYYGKGVRIKRLISARLECFRSIIHAIVQKPDSRERISLGSDRAI